MVVFFNIALRGHAQLNQNTFLGWNLLLANCTVLRHRCHVTCDFSRARDCPARSCATKLLPVLALQHPGLSVAQRHVVARRRPSAQNQHRPRQTRPQVARRSRCARADWLPRFQNVDAPVQWRVHGSGDERLRVGL